MIRRLIEGLSGRTRLEESGWDVNREVEPGDACFVVFDTETTGLDLKRDEAISLGAVKIESLRIDLSNSFYALLKPTRRYEESIKVHGITPTDLLMAGERRDVCTRFLEYAKGCVLAGYFVDIDVAMLKKLAREECNTSLKLYALDLLDMVEHRGRVPSLEEILRKYRLPISTQHNALEDAYMTALVLLKLIKEGNYRRLKDLPIKRF